ncbi:MAG: serine/threonine-protein kinase PknK [Blastocatellia bacterium]|nr:serine/threonine-protein kinase PknK [Blastocatellia bacterium]
MALNAVNSTDPIIGRKLGDFLVKEKLGEGGFGAVYKATQIILARKAVIKILHTRHRTNQNILERFKREAHLASRLEHPYCAHVYSFGAEPDGLLWIAMEMVQGTTLDTWLKLNGAMPLNRFIPLFDKICEVIHTAHELGIIHRDIKPANIMVISRAGRLLPKLLDFGIAKDLSLISNAIAQNNDISQETNNLLPSGSDAGTGERTLLSDFPKSSDASQVTALQKPTTEKEPKQEIVNDDENSNAMTLISEDAHKKNIASKTALDNELIDSNQPITHTKGVVGSPKYMSPEQWKGAVKVGIPSDIYALGVTAYEILTSKAPFKGSGIALMTAHLNDPVPALDVGFPEKLSWVLAKAMAKDPKERYQSALEFSQEIKIAVSFNEEPYNLPQLNNLLLSEILNDAPRPIAESVANLNAARNAFQLRDNILVVFRVVIRYLGLLALISHRNTKLINKDSENILATIKKLRLSGLSESEWISFIGVLCNPFASQKDLHPIPELVALFLTSDNQIPKKLNSSLVALLDLTQTHTIIKKEEQLTQDLVPVLEELTNFLSAVSFLNNYYLVIPNDEIQSIGEKWMGAIKLNKTKISLKGKNFVVDHPTLTDAEGNIIISLWPLVQIASPSLGQNKELFLLEGNGRQSAKLISLPSGFEKEDEAPWQWLKEVFFTEEEKQTTLVIEESPYPGLTTFKSENANLFYGREREIESVLNRLKITPFLAIVGPSGTGKSSFVQAGIIPNLGKNWLTVTLRPSVTPIANLLAKLDKQEFNINKFNHLKNDEKFLSYVLQDVAKNKHASILLVVDQFEELFTLCSDKDEQQLYAKYLSNAAYSEEEPIRIIITLRDDFLIKVKSLSGLQDKITQNLELLTTPETMDLLRILVEPAKKLNYVFEDSELPKEIVQTVKQEASALPLLAFTVAKLWEFRDQQFKQIRRKTYESMGGVGGALARHAESMIEQMSQSERSLVKEAFRHLITSEGTRTTLTRQELLELLGSNKDSEIVLEKLINNRLLVSAEGEKGTERIELVHEALLSSWPRLINWRQEMAEGARLRDQLRIAAQQWHERNRPKGLLWRDEALKEYQLWRERYQGKLTNLEEEFASMSLQEATYSQRLRRRLVVSAITMLVIGVALLFINNKEQKNNY